MFEPSDTESVVLELFEILGVSILKKIKPWETNGFQILKKSWDLENYGKIYKIKIKINWQMELREVNKDKKMKN